MVPEYFREQLFTIQQQLCELSTSQEGKSSVRSMANNLHPIENFLSQNRQMDKNSSTNSEPQIMCGCTALSQDVAMELIDSMPG